MTKFGSAVGVRESIKQSLKGPVRRLVRAGGLELVAASKDPQRELTGLMARLGVETLIDVGANQGQYAEHARAAGFKGHIVSFEPGRTAFERLATVSGADHMWEAYRVALGETPGELVLNISANSVSSSLLTMGERHITSAPASVVVSEERVRVARLDAELTDMQGPAMLKVDTQGYELPVLKGSHALLDRVVIVQAELSLVELYEGQASYLEVLGYLETLGFVPWALVPGFADPATGQTLQVDVVAHRASRRA